MIEIHTDGSFVFAPYYTGAWAYTIWEDDRFGRRMVAQSSGIGGGSSNECEAQAILCALARLRVMGRADEQVLLLTDSCSVKRLVEQGIVPPSEELARLVNDVRAAMRGFQSIRMVGVKRYEVRDADRLAGERTATYRHAAAEWMRAHRGIRGGREYVASR